MLTKSQQKHLRSVTKGLATSLNKEQLKRLDSLIDDILQYNCQQAALVIHSTLSKMLHS